MSSPGSLQARITIALSLAALAGCSPVEEVTVTDATDSETTDETTEGPTSDPSTSSSDSDTTTIEPTTTTETTDPSETDPTTTGTTDPPPDCDAPDGEVDDQCDASTPYCVGGSCTDCAGAPDPDAACAGSDAATPVCDTDQGSCVECTVESDALCSGLTPVCDDMSNTCAPCTEHFQCGDTACDIPTGRCFDEDKVIFVDKAFEDCDNSDGTLDAPYCNLQGAFDHVVNTDLASAWTVFVAPGTYIQGSLITPADSKIALIGDGGKFRVVSSTEEINSGHLQVDASTIFLADAVLDNNANEHGLSCMGGFLWIDDSSMKANNRHGLYAVDCGTHIRRSVITLNDRGGMVLSGEPTLASIENTFITDNGFSQADFGGVQLSNMAHLDLNYSTVVNNLSLAASSFQCLNVGSASIRNSIVVGLNPPSLDCADITIDNSAVDEGVDLGAGNLMATSADINAWLMENNGTYHAVEMPNNMASPLMDLAVWSDGDPRYDYDLDLRPQTDGSPDWAGADVP